MFESWLDNIDTSDCTRARLSSFSPRSAIWIYIVALFLAVQGSTFANELAVGSSAKVLDEFIELPLRQPEQFNFLTREEICEKRTAAVLSVRSLLLRDYRPSDKIFEQIVDGKPWWGLHGSFVFEEGQRSMEGESEESRFVLNPFLLVAASSWTVGIWDKERISDDELRQSDFPFCWQPHIARFFPKRKAMQIGYDVSSFDRRIQRYERVLRDREPNRSFGLVAYNARDFGYNYIFVPIDQSKNIANRIRTTHPVLLEQYLHCGNSCGCRDWCNNMSPEQKEIDHFEFKELPATLKALLWKKKPSSSTDEPDMTVFIELR